MIFLNTQTQDVSAVLAKIISLRSRAVGEVKTVTQAVMDRVKTEGDTAVLEFTQQWDKWPASAANLKVTPEEIQAAHSQVDPKIVAALKVAAANIENFHTAILRRKEPVVETTKGVEVWREFRPVPSVGLYIPGGKAAYPSTVLMLAIPAKAAGVPKIQACTPAGPDGKCNPSVLVAADLCGLKNIFKVGGAQAITAMAFGTELIPKVSKLFGPGNAYVTTAKLLASMDPDGAAIDMPAGPSEIAVMADDSANPEWVAADLLSQLEHGEDSQALLVSDSETFMAAVQTAMDQQIPNLPKKEIVEVSRKISFAVLVKNWNEGVELINAYAPEHLEIVMENAEKEATIAEQILNAGSVFLGAYSSEALGDYATGANHTLPTSGYAASFAPLSTDSFGKMVQFQRVSHEGIQNLGETVVTLAEAEGLAAHAASVSIRLSNLT
jgi:histidinol dehydrogenase